MPAGFGSGVVGRDMDDEVKQATPVRSIARRLTGRDHEPQHDDEMAGAAAEDEQVPEFMRTEPAGPQPRAVEGQTDRADGIERVAPQQPGGAAGGERFKDGIEG